MTNLLDWKSLDTIWIVEVPFGHNDGSSKMANLSSFKNPDMSLRDWNRYLRSHEIAHIWWGQYIKPESYRDEWITEGLAEYCAYLNCKSLPADSGKNDTAVYVWKKQAVYNAKTGPIILGKRLLSNSQTSPQQLLVSKSAYIFHMIRFMLRDYQNGSDSLFLAFLGDLAYTYKDDCISTSEFQKLLEGHTGEDMGWFIAQWFISRYS
jgi:hypothetical protein